MAENQPRKAGEYERPMTGTTSSIAFILGGSATPPCGSA